LPSDEWDDRDVNVGDLIATIDYLHKNVLDKIKLADV
jgi:hypothetical protein